MTRFGQAMEKIDERIPGIGLPLMSVSQTRGVIRRSELTDAPQRAESLDAYKVCRRNDVVFNKMSIRAGAMGVAAEDGLVTYHYEVMRPREGTDPHFIAYLMKSSWFTEELIKRERGIGAGDQANVRTTEVPFSVLKTIDAYIPGHAAQRAIADYLDRETARIDTLIEEQQRLIEMLRERRRSVASDLLGDRVGKGRRLKWLFDKLDRRAGAEVDTLPLMSVSISWGVRRRDEVTKDESRAEDLSNYKICRLGDLVINRMRAFQGALGLASEDGLVSPDYAVIRAKSEVDGEWLAAVMKSDAFVSEMRQRVKGIGSTDLGSARTPRINISDLGEIRIDLPEVKQQMEAVRQYRAEISKVDTLIAETDRFIELARERRAALITAAVTGQIDVRKTA